MKQRLRAAAKLIGDADLASAYRDALFSRFDGLFSEARPAWRPNTSRGFRSGAPAPSFAKPQSKVAAKRLAGDIEPVAAALARQAIADPPVLDDHLEALQTRGFGDPALDGLAKEIIRLRLDADHLDSDALQRHLTQRGFSALLIDVDRAAAYAGAPFPKDDVTLAAARSQWSHAFEVLNRVAALEEALSVAKHDLARGSSSSAFMSLKRERDVLRRAINARMIWTPDESP